MIAWAFSCRLIEHALGELSQRVEAMSEAEFLEHHTAVNGEARSPTIDLVASVYEREYWRRWPEGREA